MVNPGSFKTGRVVYSYPAYTEALRCGTMISFITVLHLGGSWCEKLPDGSWRSEIPMPRASGPVASIFIVQTSADEMETDISLKDTYNAKRP